MNKFEIGDRVRIKRFLERPSYWNNLGEMDKYMGTEAVIARVDKYIGLCNGIDEKIIQWAWNEDNLEHLDVFRDDDFLI